MSVAFYPKEKTLLFAIRDFEPATQRLLMSTLDVNGLILDLQAFKLVVSRHMDELIKDPSELEAARHIAYKGQVLPLLRDESNALNFQYNTYKIYLSDLGKEASRRKLCIDFDGTLSKTVDRDLGAPFEGAIESLQKFKDAGFRIVIYSCRALSDEGLRQITEWLVQYKCPYDEIFRGKPDAEYYIDDKAIPFKGDWNNVYQEVATRIKTSFSESIVIHSMFQEFDKENPLISLLEEYKKTTNIKSKEYEDLIGKSENDEPVVVTYKIDGENTAWEYTNGKATLVSREGRVRKDFPVTSDLAAALSKYKSAVGFGELYVVDKEGNSLPYPKAMSILRKPLSGEEESRIRLAIFDIDSLDGKKIESPYWERFLLIKELFSDQKHIDPIVAKQGNRSTIQEMWEQGVPEHYEGLVIHYNGVVKAKPILSQDLAVVYVERSKKHPEAMGALGLAYLDSEGHYRFAGKVGTGFSDVDRDMWMSYALENKLREEDGTIWVHPNRVVEVASKELNLRDTPLYDKDLKEIGDAPSAIGREPRLLRIREDKKVIPQDLRLEQIPSFVKEAGFPKHPDTLMVEPNEWYPKGLREEDVWNWYDSAKDKLLLALKGTPTLIVTKTDGEHVRRNDAKTGEKIQINTIEDIDKLNNGRNLEFHDTIEDNETKKIWVDLDPKENYSWQDVKKVAEEIKNLLSKLPNVEQTEVRFSGGRGIHCIAWLKKSINVDAARDMLNNLLEEEIVPRYKNTSTHISKESDQMRLDTTTLHEDGSLRALWSLNAKTGLVCSQIDDLVSAEKKDFTISHMSKTSSGFKADPNSTEHEIRWRLRDPKDFKQGSFRRWNEWAGVIAPKGIQFLVGDLESGKKALQAIRFNKTDWTEEKAGTFWKSVQSKKGFERSWTWPKTGVLYDEPISQSSGDNIRMDQPLSSNNPLSSRESKANSLLSIREVEAGSGAKELALGLGLAMAPGLPVHAPSAPVSQNVQVGWEHFEEAAKAAASKHGIPVDMFVRLLHTENASGKPWAVNPNSGAVGLAQFLPETAKERGINPLDAAESIEGAAKYLTDLHKEFGNWEDAVKAYNWGPGNVKQWLTKGGEIPAETQEYIKQIAPPPKQHVKHHKYTELSAKEVSSAFLPSLPGVVWELHDGPDMQHSPSTPLEMLHPVNEWNTYDSYTAIHDKKDPTDLLHFLSLTDIEKMPDQASDVKEEDESNEAQDSIESALGKRDIVKRAATNEEHMAHIKGLVSQRQFEKAIDYILNNKLNAPKLLKDLEDRSSRAPVLNKDQALLLLEKGSQGAQSNAVKWLAKNNNINELAAVFPLVSFNPSIAKEIIDVFKNIKNVIVLNRLFTNTSIPEGIRREIVEALLAINYIPIVDEAIKDDSEQIRSTGYKAASHLKAKDHLLEEGTKDPSAKIRREVYGYLWEAQTPTAIDLFYKGQTDEDPLIQKFVKEKIGISKSHPKEVPTHGDELTPKIIEEGVEDAKEYFKKHPELAEKLKKEQEEREKQIQYNKSLTPIKNKREKEIEEREKAKASSLSYKEILKQANDAPREFSCVLASLGEPLKKIFKDLANSIPEEEIYNPKEDPKYGREEKPHATILFGIHSQNPKEVEFLLSSKPKISATLEDFSLFEPEDKEYDVLKVSLVSKDLTELHDLLKQSLDNTESFPEYNPHLTIAYLKKGKGKNYVGDTSWANVNRSKVVDKEATFGEVQFSDKNSNKTTFPLKIASLSKEAIQPPAGITKELEPAFEWGERDDGLLAKDVKQYYGRPKSEWRNNMNLLPEFLKKMIEDEDMSKEDLVQPVKLGAGNVSLPPGTPFKLKQDLAPLHKGTPGYVLWPDKVQPYKYNPTVYVVWLKGVESNPGDILLTEDMMEFETSKVTPEVEELGQSVADQIREEIKKEKEENTPQSPADVKVMDSKTLKRKRDEMLDNMLKYPEGSPERKKWEERLKAFGMKISLSYREVTPINYDTDLVQAIHNPISEQAKSVLDSMSDSPSYMEFILRRARELKDNGRISDRQFNDFSQKLHALALNKGVIKPGQKIIASILSYKEAASNVYDDYEQTAIDDDRRLERTEDDEGVLIMDRDWISDTQTFPRGVPSPPARWVDPDREEDEVGGTKLRNGVTYWEPSPGNLDGMPAGQSFSSLTAEVSNSGARVTCSWDNEDSLSFSEQEVTSALISFIKANLPHIFDKFKSISSEHVDLSTRTLVLKFQGD